MMHLVHVEILQYEEDKNRVCLFIIWPQEKWGRVAGEQKTRAKNQKCFNRNVKTKKPHFFQIF